MIYRVRHATSYTYGRPVELASHVLHVTPRDFPGQRVIWTRLDCDPLPVRRREGVDHFGNRIFWLFHEAPHSRFDIVATSEVEVLFDLPPPAEKSLPWEVVATLAMQDPDVSQYLFDGAMCATSPAVGAWVAQSFPAGRPVIEGLMDLNLRVFREFRFRSGVTSFRTTADEILARKEGVCQDFTHLILSGLRWLGLPARYTSGYIRTRPLPGQKRRLGADVSHAWVGAWLGPDHGWIGLDPTNGIVARDEHVVLGWGRDYADISPVRGLILGGGGDSLRVGVDLVPADEWDRDPALQALGAAPSRPDADISA
ncbi:transglutaminase family protein [Acetobacter fallax]|uniref:Transglutaminase family protein n=1 Tax=Acetobacter fallax TaxID=1737473 RepID=A0ABX0K7M5_9PROT|nr:transglutaminase family protein [Acetobacter fallax]NHO31218.1 transglutaminase family protein [Acetobacter fallax]NHO34775.1 transglutaminase family protein [Acetobacter fallax]